MLNYHRQKGRTFFTGDDGCQNFLAFSPMLNSLILDSS